MTDSACRNGRTPVDFLRADHYAFVRQGIPALSVGEELKAKDPKVDGRKFVENWIATRYNAPSDDMNQPLNFDATIQYLQITMLLGYDCRPAARKTFVEAGRFLREATWQVARVGFPSLFTMRYA
jgi:hypothetical protein